MSFAVAFGIGFSVASIPGPMILLIATETLRKGPQAGVLTMLAPFLLDALVMLPLGLWLQASLFSAQGASVLAAAGGTLLIWLGVQSLRSGKAELPRDPTLSAPPQNRELPSFIKGVLTHTTNPYPYVYWSTVGATFVRQGFEKGGIPGAALFPLGFWLGASVFTLLTIYLLARGQRFLSGRETLLGRLSAVLLMACGGWLIFKALAGVFFA